jgi:hypothetical protein
MGDFGAAYSGRRPHRAGLENIWDEPMPRLLACDLEILGIFLFGPRWQCPLARAIHRDDRLVRRWLAEERPVSIAASRLIETLARDKHGEQMRRLRASYLNMIESLSDTAIRGRLLAMDLGAPAGRPWYRCRKSCSWF